MSRTYRLRHYPPIPGGRFSGAFRKCVDSCGRFDWRARRDLADAEVTRLLGPKPEPHVRMVHVKGLTRTVWHPAEYRKDSEGHFVKDALGRLIMTKAPWREEMPGRLMTTQDAWEWERAVDHVADEMVYPVGTWHPWQRHSPVGSRKKFERVQANRGMRRRSKQLLCSETCDEDWDGHFPERRDYFDWWSIY